MKKFSTLLIFVALCLTGCSVDGVSDGGGFSGRDSNAGGGSGGNYEPGTVTSGEWNDLNNWPFWQNLQQNNDFKDMWPYWSFSTANRVSVLVKGSNGVPAIDVPVALIKDGIVLFSARTDNKGKAELWQNIFTPSQEAIAMSSSTILDINNGSKIVTDVKYFAQGINEAVIAQIPVVANKIEIAFVVDATGSMGDELEYLKTELYDVIGRVKDDNPQAAVATSSVFYRDEGDQYVTRISGFTNNTATTINFIKEQNAAGGGDFPEAVHTALDKAVNELQWSASAKTRLLFLILDAPPHYNTQVIDKLHELILKAAEKGIKVIPVTASDIDKETEFLMRFFSISTNGPYVFITNHSGVGNEHLEPTVGEYEVEFLNNLLVRLINKYAE
jgi:hypothetical protein